MLSANIINFFIFPGGLFVILFGLFLMSLERILVARFQGRVGPPFYQNVIDIVKLFNKETMIPHDAKDFVFKFAPLFGFSGMLALAFFLPIPGVYKGVEGDYDLIILIYFMALPAISHILGGGASASPYAAISVSRELKLMFVYEFLFIIVLMSISLYVGRGIGDFSLKSILDYQAINGPLLFDWKFWPAFIAFIIFVLATLEIPPFEVAHHNSADVMDGFLMEYSGAPLGMFEIIEAIKIVILSILFQILFFPVTLGDNPIINTFIFIAKTLVFIFFISLIHASVASFRADQEFKFLIKVPFVLAMMSLILVILNVKGII